MDPKNEQGAEGILQGWDVPTSQVILSQERLVCTWLWASSTYIVVPPVSPFPSHRVSSGCLVYKPFPLSLLLEFKTFDWSTPHSFTHLSRLWPRKEASGCNPVCFCSFQTYLENSVLQRFLLFSNRLKFCHSEVLAFKTEWGLITQAHLLHQTPQCEPTSNQESHTSPGRDTAESVCGNL